MCLNSSIIFLYISMNVITPLLKRFSLQTEIQVKEQWGSIIKKNHLLLWRDPVSYLRALCSRGMQIFVYKSDLWLAHRCSVTDLPRVKTTPSKIFPVTILPPPWQSYPPYLKNCSCYYVRLCTFISVQAHWNRGLLCTHGRWQLGNKIITWPYNPNWIGSFFSMLVNVCLSLLIIYIKMFDFCLSFLHSIWHINIYT